MISLYIHIPFCKKKCKYCSFFVVPIEDNSLDNLVKSYYNTLLKQIDWYTKLLKDKNIKTIYIGGGTPLVLGKNRLFNLIDFLKERFDLTYLEEITIELNPDPYNVVLDFVEEFSKKYKSFYRIRFSFGIQTFNDEILQKSGRGYIFNTLIGFLRQLQKIKRDNNIFNFDFIAFGKKWRDYQYKFFEKFVNSLFADSFSIYMLELFPGSYRYDGKYKLDGFDFVDDDIYEEFSYFKKILYNAGYKRYEISNFSLLGKESLHNLVYWNLEDWLGIGMSAVGFIRNFNKLDISKLNLDIKNNTTSLRFEGTNSWKDYLEGNRFKKVDFLSEGDLIYEEFMMKLRLKRGVFIEKYLPILKENWQEKIGELQENGLIEFKEGKLKLTDKGMDFYNHVFTELVK